MSAVEHTPRMNETKYTPFLWPTLRGIALIVSICAFMRYMSVLIYGGELGIAVPITFLIASFALMAMSRKRETSPRIYPNSTAALSLERLPWSLFAYCAILGLGFTWVCAFLWFSRRQAFFSLPVVGAMLFILALYAAIGFAVACLTRGDWRTAMLVFSLAPCAVSGMVLRLHLLR